MKPRTKLQKEVVALRERFYRTHSLEYDMRRALKSTFENLAFYDMSHKTHTAYCMECGHSWKPKSLALETCRCPKCGRKLHVQHTPKRVIRDFGYTCVISAFEGWQVLTYHLWRKEIKRKHAAEYFDYGEMIQRWISPTKGTLTFARRKLLSYGYVMQPWALDSDMELRDIHKGHGYYSHYDSYDANAGVCIRSLLPSIRGVKWTTEEAGTPYGVISRLLTHPHYFTLLKARQFQLFYYANAQEVNTHWASMKICIRNNYFPKHGTDWLDMVAALEACNKDVHNAFYVCPENLDEAHDYWINRKRKLERERDDKADNLTYIKEHKKYFHIELKTGDITIRPLQSVTEFKEEGDAMGHCVYSMKYYKKANSLILSARKNDERVATIEYDLSNGKILQCRGAKNSTSPFDKQIRSCFSRNKRLIMG